MGRADAYGAEERPEEADGAARSGLLHALQFRWRVHSGRKPHTGPDCRQGIPQSTVFFCAEVGACPTVAGRGQVGAELEPNQLTACCDWVR